MKLVEITQRMLEKYEELLSVIGEEAEEQHSVARWNRCMLEAAIKSEMAEDLPDDLLDLKVWQIKEYSADILQHVAEAKAPPDPN